jgi:dUTP pyrophosphatase
MIEIKIINKSDNALPAYQTSQAAGMDLCANLNEPIILKPFERFLIPTGLFLEIPTGFEMQIRPRSGLALKHGISVLNSPGTIDADYRGEIKVLLINLGQEDFKIENGERVAQMILAKHEIINWQLTHILAETDRGSGGYGSTGR